MGYRRSLYKALKIVSRIRFEFIGSTGGGSLGFPCKETLTVGTDKDYATIGEAITAAKDNYCIVIDAGTYVEHLDLTTKKVRMFGSGSLETIIFWNFGGQSLFSTVDIGTDCTFDNIVFDKREVFAGAAKPIVNVSGCSPIFTNCQVGREIYVDSFNSQKPMTIANGSNVTMTGCAIKGTTVSGTLPYDLLVTDTSALSFQGSSFFACLRLQNTAVANINTDYLWTAGASSNNPGIVSEGNSRAFIKINISERAYNVTTRAEQPAGTFTSSGYQIAGYMHLSGKQITSTTGVTGTGEVLFQDIVSTFGAFRVGTGAGVTGATITFDNCQIVQDLDNDVSGYHIIEDAGGSGVTVRNGSVLEFSGHSGNWNTFGNPVVCDGHFVMSDSTVIDNVNDNIPAGANYQSAILAKNLITISNSTITNQNWDGVGVNRLINFQRTASININLTNVVLNNAEVDTPPIHFQGNEANLDGNDYICESNLTNNTTGFILGVDTGTPASTWATLTGNCP